MQMSDDSLESVSRLFMRVADVSFDDIASMHMRLCWGSRNCCAHGHYYSVSLGPDADLLRIDIRLCIMVSPRPIYGRHSMRVVGQTRLGRCSP